MSPPTNTTTTSRVFYSAWFCPYAQRVWMALNHLSVPHQLIESMSVDPSTQAYLKSPELLLVNPKGLVPVLVTKKRIHDDGDHIDDKKSEINNDDNVDEIMYESLEILKVIFRESSRQCSKDDDEYDNNDAAANKYNRIISSPFYRVLMKQNKDERMKGWLDMTNGLESFSDGLKWRRKQRHDDDDETIYDESDDISFYGFDFENPCLVDFAVFPWVHRLYLIEHYCGLKYGVDTTTTSPSSKTTRKEEAVNKIQAWRAKMENLQSVKNTLPPREDLIAVYQRYADGTAKSQVGYAVRSGKEAHSIEEI